MAKYIALGGSEHLILGNSPEENLEEDIRLLKEEGKAGLIRKYVAGREDSSCFLDMSKNRSSSISLGTINPSREFHININDNDIEF